MTKGKSKQTDQQLVDQVFKGNKHAFDLLVLRYQHRILALVSRFIRDQSEVEDVCQEAFIKAYRALPKFRGDSAFYTWLYRIAINTAKNHMVTKGRRPPGTDVDLGGCGFSRVASRAGRTMAVLKKIYLVMNCTFLLTMRLKSSRKI